MAFSSYTLILAIFTLCQNRSLGLTLSVTPYPLKLAFVYDVRPGSAVVISTSMFNVVDQPLKLTYWAFWKRQICIIVKVLIL